MRPLIRDITTGHSPESLVEQLRGSPRQSAAKAGEPGIVLLRSRLFDSPQARYSLVAARPFLTFRSFGSRCEIAVADSRLSTLDPRLHFGNPWRLLDRLIARYELLDDIDLPFPLGGCFGFWGYDLKNFVEPKLPRRAVNDLELPDCQIGFYDSLVAFDHHLGKTWIISTGLNADGSRSESRANAQLNFWSEKLAENPDQSLTRPRPDGATLSHPTRRAVAPSQRVGEGRGEGRVSSTLSRADFIVRVEQAQRYIRSGDIYQVNLSQRLAAACECSGWEFFKKLSTVSPAPFSAFLDCGEFQIASSSPELFLRLSGAHAQTRPIKGTRPRSAEPTRDAQLACELQTSAKEMAELVMITDLLRNDLGKVCEFNSVQVPELLRLERYPQVQHLVSTVEGRLRPDVTHLGALASCFPGGSITGAPKIRAMEIVDELEPIARGPYTGALGYLGFNRESQLSIIIRTALCKDRLAHFNVGAGIVADSNPEAEYEETLDKAAGFLAALNMPVGETGGSPVPAGNLPAGKSRV
jgi:para-aminobenzoate synthetase component I